MWSEDGTLLLHDRQVKERTRGKADRVRREKGGGKFCNVAKFFSVFNLISHLNARPAAHEKPTPCGRESRVPGGSVVAGVGSTVEMLGATASNFCPRIIGTGFLVHVRLDSLWAKRKRSSTRTQRQRQRAVHPAPATGNAHDGHRQDTERSTRV